MTKTPLMEQARNLSHIRFPIRMEYLFKRSIDIFKKKFSEEHDYLSDNAFILDSLLELFMRVKEGVILNYSSSELNSVFNSLIGILYNSQIRFLDKGLIGETFGILFSLWQFEEQENSFIKLFRYSYFFNFHNDSLDMRKKFFDSFGCDYSEFISLLVDVICISISSDYNNYYRLISQTVLKHPKAFLALRITSDDYFKESVCLCANLEDIAFSLKVSHTFPFIDHKGHVYLPLPHACITACTKSLLYRITYKKDDARREIGKEVMENYVYYLSNSSGVYDRVSKEVYFNSKKKILSSDVLCFKDDCLVAMECKLLTPSSKSRLLDEESIKITKRILIDDLCKLYKSLFVYYSATEDNGLPFIEKEKRYGIVVLLERIDFDHKSIIEEVGKKLGASENEVAFLKRHIRFDALYSIEELSFRKGNAIEEMKYMAKNNKEYDFSLSKKSCSKNYCHNDFVSFKKRILNFDKKPS